MFELKRLLVIALLICCSILSAGNYYDVISKAEEWINREYKPGTVAYVAASGDLLRIVKGSFPEEEKISQIQKLFPKAFQREEKNLIFLQPISWSIHSLKLGFDISETATQITKVDDIYKVVTNNTARKDTTVENIVKSTGTLNGRVETKADLNIANPFSWLKVLLGSKLKLSGSCSYDRNSVDATRELWSRSHQAVFSRESAVISKMIHHSEVKGFHLTFTVTVSNNSSESVICNVKDAYIPIYTQNGESFNKNATPVDKKDMEIPPQRTKDIVFRLELDNTNGRALAEYMSHSAPVIDFLKGGSLSVTGKNSGKDMISASLEQARTTKVSFVFPEFFGDWNIREFHTSNGEAVTVREALEAISKDFDFAIGKTDLFGWNGTRLDMVSSVPFGKLKIIKTSEDTNGYIAFLQKGTSIYDDVNNDILHSKLGKEPITIWVVRLQLEQLGDNLKSLPMELQKKLREKLEAQKEELFAAVQLAFMYSEGIGGNSDIDKAFGILERLPEDLASDVALLLGSLCLDQKDYNKAEKWFRKSAVQGNADAQCMLGDCYYNGKGVAKDESEAVKWYRKSALQGNADAQFLLGRCYYNGKGVAKDESEAVKWYLKSAVQGDAYAQCRLGFCYYYGKGVAKDESEAVKWYRKSAVRGNAYAQFLLGRCYYNGKGVAKDESEAVKWYLKSAVQGHAYAQFSLGICYHYGKGVAKDESEAVKWYRKSADQGNANAQRSLGFCYNYGKGVAKDESEAVKWYRKSAVQGNAYAQFLLGCCYYYGKGVAKDESEAVKWYRKSAVRGNAYAQYMLGDCYYDGKGVAKDESEAVKWYCKSAVQGNAYAQKALEEMGR